MMDRDELRILILNSEVPLVFKDVMKSELESWDLTMWNEMFKDHKLSFRSGINKYGREPQWETTSKTIEGTFNDFIKHCKSDLEDWWYFDYKYLKNFPDLHKLQQFIHWENLGFCNVSENGVLWIGSKGAHTCCHKDTYGCNVVYQIYGRKQWLLFPPQEPLKPTRIPYEESSIYSKLNFFSPNPDDFVGIDNCYKIILNPGDVLLVPHKWWHYVENLETAISVNNWISLAQDRPEQVKEAVAQILFSKLTVGLNEEEKMTILNPNMMKDMTPCQTLFNVIGHHINNPNSDYRIPKNNEDILMKYSKSISKITKLPKQEFQHFLRDQRNRFDRADSSDSKNNNAELSLVDFLDIITDEDVLELISRKLLERNKNNS